MTTRRLRAEPTWRTPRRRPHSDCAAACINGRIVSSRSALIPVDDWGFLYGWGVFETIRLHRRRALFLDRHLERMESTAAALRLPGGVAPDSWRQDVERTIRRSQLSEGAINLYWTLGAPGTIASSRIVCIRPRPRIHRRPLRVWVAPWRVEPTSPGVGVKTMAYFPNMFALSCAWREGYDTAILLNTQDRLADAATSSVFIIEKDRIVTPSLGEGALPGVTRGLVLTLARELGLNPREAPITWRRFLASDGVFLTSTLRSLSLVGQIGDIRCRPTRSALRLLGTLQARYSRLVSAEIRRIPSAF
ncbi:MAG TPA: aminotransferase class IV [candidate division Zixibacteria bacterium]